MTYLHNLLSKVRIFFGTVFLILTLSNAHAEPEPPSLIPRYFPSILSISPDGKIVLEKDLKGDSLIARFTARENGASLDEVEFQQSFLSPVWSPMSDQIAYFSDEAGNQQYQLSVYSLQQKRVCFQNVRRSQAISAKWSPDGKKLAFVSQNAQQRTLVILFLQSCAEKETQGSIELPFPLSRDLIFTWSPDSDALAFVADHSPQTLVTYRLSTKQQEHFETSRSLQTIKWLDKTNHFLLASRTGNEEFPRLYLFETESKTFHTICSFPEKELLDLQISPDSQHVVSTFVKNGNISLQLCDLRNDLVTSFEDPERNFLFGGLSTQELFLLSSSPFTRIPQLSTYRFSRNKTATFSKPIDAGVKIGNLKNIEIQNGANNIIHAFHWIPSVETTNDKKLLIMVHGGPHLQYFRLLRPEIEFYLQNKIDVLQLNYHGSRGYGARYAEQNPDAWKDIISAIDYATNILGFRRQDIFVLGDSYGAGITLQAASKLEGELGGVVLFSYLGNLQDKGKAPDRTIVYHGENDANCTPERAFESLKRYWQVSMIAGWRPLSGEGHSFRKPSTWRQIYQEILTFIDSSPKK